MTMIYFSKPSVVVALAAFASVSVCERLIFGQVAPPTPSKSATATVANAGQVDFTSLLRRAREMMSENKREYKTSQFNELLVTASPSFPTLKAAAPGEPVPWQKVTLNTKNARFDALQFSSPLTVNGNLVWSFAVPTEAQFEWYIKPSKWGMFGFRSYHPIKNVQIDKLPERNLVVLQQLAYFDIKPDISYYLYFKFDDEKPVDFYVKLKVLPESGEPVVDRAYDLAKQLDFELPFRFTRAARLFPDSNTSR